MHIKNILLPIEELTTISVDTNISHALELIEKNNYLSLPVVEGNKFIGVLSKKYVYETFFKSNETDRQKFLSKKVNEFMKTKIPVLKDNVFIENAADIFLKKKLRFIPVVNEKDEFIGIITQKSIFKQYREIFGFNHPKLVVYTYDFKGKLAKLTDIVYKHGGNITSIVQMNTEVMGLQEISLRIKTDNIDKIIKKLQNHGFEVREITKK